MIPKPLKAVIFDMDGLLLDTEAFYRVAIFRACASLGYTLTDSVHLSLIGTPKELGDEKLIAYFGERFNLTAYHQYRTLYFDELCDLDVPLRPGAKELLEILAQREIPTGVATSTSRELAEDRLKKAGIWHFIDVLIGRTDVINGKPHPESFLKAAELLNVHPFQCIALEDSYNGVRAAAAAGMASIMIPDLLEPTEEMRALCVRILPSLRDVAAILMDDSPNKN